MSSSSILDSVRSRDSFAGREPPLSPPPAPPPHRGPVPARDDARRALLIAVAVVAILVAIHCLLPPRGLGRRLAEKGWVLYVLEGCSFCTKQLGVLGGDYPRLVECGRGGVLKSPRGGAPPLACGEVGSYPTFFNEVSKERKAGFQPRESLEKMCA